MSLITGIRSILLGACLVSPTLAFASTQITLPQDDCLTWTLVGSSASRAVDSQAPIENGKISALMALKNNEGLDTPARLEFYLGPASNPPASIVGQDYHGDLASRVKYGIYLVSTF